MSEVASGLVVREVAVGETEVVHASLVALRPHHKDREAFVARIDDVQRAQGYRLLGALLDAVVAEARERCCDAVHLDSGHQRHDAHELYLAYGFDMTSHHVAITL